MKHIIMLIKIILIFFLFALTGNLCAQEIPKDKIVLNFTQYKDKCEDIDLLKHLKKERKEGVQFNLCGKAIFLHPTNVQVDTISNTNLEEYTFATIENIETLVHKWREKVRPMLQKKYGKLFPQTENKNNMFETYLTEKLSDDYTAMYRVYWLNQEIQR